MTITSFAYPDDLLPELKELWQQRRFRFLDSGAALPSDAEIMQLLQVAYHASFLTEEGRRLGFRLAYIPRDEPNSGWGGATPIPFDSPREFSVAEILRLAPATDPTKMLICVEMRNTGGLVIWGMLDVGSSWYKFVTGQASEGTYPPDALALSSVEPGNITLSRRGHILLSLRSGQIVKPSRESLSRGPVGDFFATSREHLRQNALGILDVTKWDDDDIDDDYPARFHTQFIERLLFHVRQRFHGGTLIFVRDDITLSDSRLTDRIIIKYPADYALAWEHLVTALTTHYRFYDLYFRLSDKKSTIPTAKFQEVQLLESQMKEAEEAITEAITALAAFSGVDGAVVLTDKYRLLGFGAEVIVNSPTLRFVSVASDAEATKTSPRAIEAYGTRHRSAFRFCSSYEDALAFVISQDGGVKAVRRDGADVIMWPDINFGPLGF